MRTKRCRDFVTKPALYQVAISKDDQIHQEKLIETDNQIIPQQVCSKVTVNKKENSDVTTEEKTLTSSNREVSSASKHSSETRKKSINTDRTPMTTNVNNNLGRFVLEIIKH